jgi:hypothetical protein
MEKEADAGKLRRCIAGGAEASSTGQMAEKALAASLKISNCL